MATQEVKDGGAEFSTLASALADAGTGPGDTIEISGTWDNDDTDVCTIADANLIIEAIGSSKCDPYAVSSPTHYRLRCNSSGNHCFIVGASGTTIDGLEIKQASTGESDELFRMVTASCEITVKNSLLYFASRNSQQDGFYVEQVDGCTINLENCIMWNVYRSAIGFYHTSAGTLIVNINSCSFYDIGYSTVDTTRSGILGSSNSALITAKLFNCLIHVNASSYAFTCRTVNDITVSVDRCIYNGTTWDVDCDVTITDCLTNHNWTDDNSKSSDGDWVIVEDVTSTPYDFRLQTNIYNEAQDMHADASGLGLSMPATDIAGTSRPQNTNYDAGAFEYTSGGPAEWTAHEHVTLGFS